MAASSKRRRLLSHTRPKSVVSSTASSISSKTTRRVIRQHHNLHKQLAKANAAGDHALADSLQAQIDAAGGLEAYQSASLQGQSVARGGDSSQVLIQWMQKAFKDDELKPSHINANDVSTVFAPMPPLGRLRLLEVGALRPDNVCARSRHFDVVQIDLHSQHPDILQQDFMQRPLPQDTEALYSEGFDVISLSLVLNYVSDPEDRGRMLERTTRFLRHSPGKTQAENCTVPGLFLVLPAPCICNSRYLNEDRLASIMRALGYNLIHQKYTNKLAYYYWHLAQRSRPHEKFTKLEVASGANRNNFAIVLK